MKKKLVIILSFIIAIVLCVPSVPALADDNIKIYSYDIVYSALGEHDNGEFIYGWDYTENNKEIAVSAVEKFKEDYPDATNFIGMFSGNEVQFYTSTAPINVLFGGDIHYTNYVGVACGFYTSFSNIDVYRYTYDSNNDSLNAAFLYTFLTISQNGNSYRWQFAESQRDVFAFEGDVHFYSLDELNSSGVLNPYLTNGNSIGSSGVPETMMRNVLIDYDYSQLFDYADASLPYYNGSQVVDPTGSVSENNTNHLYLTGCDAGFTKPLSLNNLNSSGGGYVYFTYNFDDWINNHSGDYTLQCNSTFYINNSTTGTIVRKNLDISGVAIYALSELGDFVDWQNLNTTFMGYPNQVLTGNYIKGYVYSLTYNQFGILQERYAKAGAHTVGYWVVKFANMLPGVKITENNVNYQEYFNSVVPSRFDLKVSFKIIDNVSGEESGTYIKTFNMLTGVSNVDSNSIQDNNNPYEPINSDDLQLPSIGDDNNGYLIETGDNNQIVNLTTPDNIKLFIDNGFQNFLSWYETSSDTAYASNRFWSSMGIFENNPATELYSEYFGFLPDDFKTLIFSCAGIGIVGGAYCILRRRLH